MKGKLTISQSLLRSLFWQIKADKVSILIHFYLLLLFYFWIIVKRNQFKAYFDEKLKRNKTKRLASFRLKEQL